MTSSAPVISSQHPFASLTLIFGSIGLATQLISNYIGVLGYFLNLPYALTVGVLVAFVIGGLFSTTAWVIGNRTIQDMKQHSTAYAPTIKALLGKWLGVCGTIILIVGSLRFFSELSTLGYA